MMTSMKRMAVMSAALILFCVTVVAQSETTESCGVRIQNYDELGNGQVEYYPITILEGYKNPILIYEYASVQINTTVNGRIFNASIVVRNGELCVKIEAKHISEMDEDTIFVKAVLKYEEDNPNRRLSQIWGAPLTIRVNPKKKY